VPRVVLAEGADDTVVALLEECDVAAAVGGAVAITVTLGLDKTCAMLDANAS